jgi:hypothetical protein
LRLPLHEAPGSERRIRFVGAKDCHWLSLFTFSFD